MHEQKWAAQLADFDFTIKYKKARLNKNADALSRLTDSDHVTSLDSMDIISECIQGTVIPDDVKSAQSAAIYIQSSDVSRADTFPSYTNKELYDMQSKDAVLASVWSLLKRKLFRDQDLYGNKVRKCKF